MAKLWAGREVSYRPNGAIGVVVKAMPATRDARASALVDFGAGTVKRVAQSDLRTIRSGDPDPGAFGYWPGEDARPLSRAQREGFA